MPCLPATGETDRDLLLTVVDRIHESEHIVSLLLKPTDPDRWIPFRAGQHLPLRLGLPQRALATYTISSSPDETGIYRISVKREPDGSGGSAYLHDQAPIGATLRASKPRGTFFLGDKPGPVILLTGGVGVTPALSMLKQLVRDPDRPVYFIHAARNNRDHAFGEEVRALTEGRPNVFRFIAYSEGTPEDLVQGACSHLGLIDREVLRKLLPLDRYAVYLCGPTGFMSAMREALVSLGVPSETILQEDFGGPKIAAPLPASAPPIALESSTGTGVRFRRSDVSATWTPATGSLLDLAEEIGLTPEFSCRSGVCGTCACKLLSGTVAYDEEPVDPPPEGEVLICCARPVGAVELDI